jgi:hypothetical protein
MDPPEDFIAKLLKDERHEPDRELDWLAHQVIGAAIEVHRQLGPGLLEGVDEKALCIEFELRGITFRRQSGAGITYNGIEGRNKASRLILRSLAFLASWRLSGFTNRLDSY